MFFDNGRMLAVAGLLSITRTDNHCAQSAEIYLILLFHEQSLSLALFVAAVSNEHAQPHITDADITPSNQRLQYSKPSRTQGKSQNITVAKNQRHITASDTRQ